MQQPKYVRIVVEGQSFRQTKTKGQFNENMGPKAKYRRQREFSSGG